MNIKPVIKKLNSIEKIVRVCAEYDPPSDQQFLVLTNAIYDVEIQSGYIYQKIVDYEIRAHDIKVSK